MKRGEDIPAPVKPPLTAERGHTYEYRNASIYMAVKIPNIDYLILINVETGRIWSAISTFDDSIQNFVKVKCIFQKIN